MLFAHENLYFSSPCNRSMPLKPFLIPYFTINNKSNSDLLDLNWLQKRNLYKKFRFIDWYKFDQNFIINLDGISGFGNIQKPIKPLIEAMNEEESSGI